MHLQLDLLDKVRTTAEQRMTRYQDLMAKHYNTKVKPRHFQVGDLVLRKVTIATKDPSQGSWAQIGRDHTRSLTAIGRGLTIWKPSTGRDFITRGTPST